MELILKQGGHADLKRIYPMMQFDFGEFELEPLVLLQKALWDKGAELLLLKDESGTERGYALMLRGALGYEVLGWIGVYPTGRGQGLGHRFVELLLERYKTGAGVVIEVKEDETGKRLQGFYGSLGFVQTGLTYSISDRPYVLMQRNNDAGPLLSEEAARVIIRGAYGAMLPTSVIDRKYAVGVKL